LSVCEGCSKVRDGCGKEGAVEKDSDSGIKILFEVTSGKAAKVLVPLARACNRNSISWACFFTGNGVKNLSDEDVKEIITGAVKAVACEVSWEQYMGDDTCPVETGSQTNNSALVGETEKVVSI
jgi:hypothetical protein